MCIFYAHKTYVLIGKKTLIIIIIIFEGYISLCLPPFNSNFRYLEIKSCPWGFNLQDSTACADPESFVRGGPNFDRVFLFVFLADERRED